LFLAKLLNDSALAASLVGTIGSAIANFLQKTICFGARGCRNRKTVDLEGFGSERGEGRASPILCAPLTFLAEVQC
jgi:hypothetical protein